MAAILDCGGHFLFRFLITNRFPPSIPSNFLTLYYFYGETGQFPIFIFKKIMTLKYWCHILNSSSRSPLRHCYKSLIHFDRSGKVNWVTHVKQLLCSIGLQDTWREQRIENSKRFMKDIEITIKNDYINIWRQATTSAPKLRTYITFKK